MINAFGGSRSITDHATLSGKSSVADKTTQNIFYFDRGELLSSEPEKDAEIKRKRVQKYFCDLDRDLMCV